MEFQCTLGLSLQVNPGLWMVLFYVVHVNGNRRPWKANNRRHEEELLSKLETLGLDRCLHVWKVWRWPFCMVSFLST